MQYRDSPSIRIATLPMTDTAVTFPIRFATCVAAALSAVSYAGAILPDVRSPSRETQARSSETVATAQASSNAPPRAQLPALRVSFVTAIKSAGLKPSIAPPQIALDNP